MHFWSQGDSHYKDGGARFKQYESFLKNRKIDCEIQPDDLKMDPDDFYAKVMPDLKERTESIKKNLPAEFPYPHYSNSQLKEDYENCTVSEIMRKNFCPPLNFSNNNKAIINAVKKQNFVPIVDDRGYLSGILTRQSVISYLSGNVI